MPRTITFIGSGQVTATIAGMLALHNRGITNEEDRVRISILGKEGSPSFTSMRDHGFSLVLDGARHDFEPLEFAHITSDTDKIGPQDHIFVATKAFSYDERLMNSIMSLKKPEWESRKVTEVIIGQNGVPFWFVEEMGGFALDSVKDSRRWMGAIGKTSIVGCVLNLACEMVGSGSDGGKNTYNVLTPTNKISVPVDHVDGEYRDQSSNIHGLRKVLKDAGIDVSMVERNIRKELLLKLQVNAAVNGICTITGLNIGAVMADEGYKKVAFAAATEIADIASNLYRGMTLRSSEKLGARLIRSASHFTSMKKDFDLGGDIEIDAIYGAPSELSTKRGFGSKEIITKISQVLRKMQSEKGSKSVEDIRSDIVTDLNDLVEMASTYREPSPVNVPTLPLQMSGAGSSAPNSAREEIDSSGTDSRNQTPLGSEAKTPSGSPEDDNPSTALRGITCVTLKDRKPLEQTTL